MGQLKKFYIVCLLCLSDKTVVLVSLKGNRFTEMNLVQNS